MNFKRTMVATTIMLLTSICLAYLTRPNDQPLKVSLSRFPMEIGEWQGTTSRFDQKIYDVLGVDDSVLANYYNRTSEHVQLYIGYYMSQREGEIIHSPKNCMPGSGWNIVESSFLALDVNKKKDEHSKVIKLVLQKGYQREILLYWFHSRGRIINSEYSQKFYLVWDAITKHRTDGSFVRLMSRVVDQDEIKTTQRLKQFAEQMCPILDEFIPT